MITAGVGRERGARGAAAGHDDGVSERGEWRWLVAPRKAVARWIVPVYAVFAVALVPWVAYLAWTLPARSVSQHYRLAWVGFDVMLCLALARTAWLAWRRSPFVVNVASATAALLVVDAWFDVTTSPGGDDLMVSAALALLVELPLAVMSLVLAGRAQLEIARTGAVPRRRWIDRLGTEEQAPDLPAAAQTSTPPEAADSRR